MSQQQTSGEVEQDMGVDLPELEGLNIECTAFNAKSRVRLPEPESQLLHLLDI